MPTILHVMTIEADPAAVYTALSTIDGLSSWWTSTTEGSCAPGDVIGFRFGEHVARFRVDSSSSSQVKWTCLESAPEWVGTTLTFDLRPADTGTSLRFAHAGWAEQSDFFGHCSLKWGVFMLSLKSALETGLGRPFPNDQPI